MTWAQVGASVVSGVVLGSFYALMSSGLSIVWGTVRVFNFAHGTLLAFGAYAAWWVSNDDGLGLGIVLGIVSATIMTGAAGALVGFLVVRPFLGRKEAQLAVILTTLAASIILQNGIQLVFGPRLKRLDRVIDGDFDLLGTTASYQEVLVLGLAATLLIGFYVFLRSSRLGLAIQAVEQNHAHAQLVGIPVERTYLWVFAISAAFAGLAGSLVGALGFVDPAMGDDPLLKAFIVVIFGGLGSLVGTIMASFTVGMLEAFSSQVIGLYWTPAVLFGALIIVMLVRPQGLLGQKES